MVEKFVLFSILKALDEGNCACTCGCACVVVQMISLFNFPLALTCRSQAHKFLDVRLFEVSSTQKKKKNYGYGIHRISLGK